MRTAFIYALNDPRTGECRYVGRTFRPEVRVSEHVYQARTRSTPKDVWVLGLLTDGVRPQLEVLEEAPETDADFWEREYIKVFRLIGVRLTNLSEGGQAPAGLPESSLEKMRVAGRSRFFSEETRAKMRAARLGKPSPNAGKPHSEEAKKRISDGGKGLKRSQETRDRISQALAGRTFSETHRLNISRAKRKT